MEGDRGAHKGNCYGWLCSLASHSYVLSLLLLLLPSQSYKGDSYKDDGYYKDGKYYKDGYEYKPEYKDGYEYYSSTGEHLFDSVRLAQLPCLTSYYTTLGL
jgi:hypothetical protein